MRARSRHSLARLLSRVDAIAGRHQHCQKAVSCLRPLRRRRHFYHAALRRRHPGVQHPLVRGRGAQRRA
eukprot:6213444-Pleurochrysis_carterae.AAC.2